MMGARERNDERNRPADFHSPTITNTYKDLDMIIKRRKRGRGPIGRLRPRSQFAATDFKLSKQSVGDENGR